MTSFITNLWNRLCYKQTPITIMIIGLDNSGKTSILNSLHSLTTTLSHQHESSSASSNSTSSAQASKLGDIPQQQKHQERSPHDSEANATSSGDLPSSSGGLNSIVDEENLLLNETDGFGKQELSSSSRPILENKLCKLSGSYSRRRSCDSYSPTVGYNFERLHYKGQTLNVLDISGQSKYRGLWQEFYNCVDAIVFVIDSSDLIRLVVVRDELENTLNHPYFSTLQQNKLQDSNEISSENNNNNNNSNVRNGIATGVSLYDSNRMRHPSQFFDMVQKQLTIKDGKLIQSPLERSSPRKLTTNQQRSSDATIMQPKQQRRRQSVGSPETSINCRPAMCQGLRARVPILFLANKTDLTNSMDTEAMVKTLNLSHLAEGRHPWHIQATSVKTSQGIVEGFDWLIGQLVVTKV